MSIYTIWLREMKRFLRAKSRIITSVATPFFWLAIVGIGFSASISIGGLNYLAFMAPGIIGITLLFTSVFAGVSVIWERQFGFLKEILVAPISRTSIVLGKTLGSSTVSLINGIIVMLIAILMGAIGFSLGIFTAIVFMILVSIVFVSIGLIIASRMRSMEGFQMVISFFILPVFFLSGALFPLNNVPDWMKALSYINPLTYGIDGLRGSLISSSLFPLWLDLMALIGFSAAFILIGSYLFGKAE